MTIPEETILALKIEPEQLQSEVALGFRVDSETQQIILKLVGESSQSAN
ncbi:hypothetical protein [Calothrix sp. NIES-2100]